MSLEADHLFKECLSLLKMIKWKLPATGFLAIFAVSPKVLALETLESCLLE